MKITSMTQSACLVLLFLAPAYLGDPPLRQPDQGILRTRTVGEIQLQPCNIEEYGPDALCGKYELFEDRAAKNGRKIALSLVVLPSLAKIPAADPVFFLAGGPGMGASMLALFGGGRWKYLRESRDVIYLDQRGTGNSNPLQCDLNGDGAIAQSYFNEMFPIDLVRRCREKLESVADLKLYTTPIAMADLDDVRRAFGYAKINIYGVSYGTWAALEYLRQSPDHVRAMVLAGVATPATRMPLNFARNAQIAMDGLIGACAEQLECNDSFPNLRNEWASVLAEFKTGPIHFTFEHPINHSRQSVTLSRGVFVERLRLMLYDLDAASSVPLFIHAAAHGNWAPFATAVVNSTPLGILANGMYLTVTCSESVSRIAASDISRAIEGSFLGDYRIVTHRRACEEWPKGDIPSAYFDPVTADVPVLMFSGMLDAATQPQPGTDAVKHLANGRQIIVRNASHNYSSECFQALTTEFFAKASAKHLDTSCTGKLKRPPFVTELSAPANR